MSEIGRWITSGGKAPFYVRKEIIIKKNVQKAEAKVCGLGQFLFWINGKKVSDHELDPGWTDYRKYIEYVTFDVSDMLSIGENVIGAEIGNGWFIKTDEGYTFSFPPFMPPNPNPYQAFGKALVFAAKLMVTYEDGTLEMWSADDTWKINRHPVIMSNVYGSETKDGRLVLDGWSTAEYDDSDWKKAQIVPVDEEPAGVTMQQKHPAVKVIRSYEGRCLGKTGGREIYDFGQNMSGLFEFDVRGHAGDIVRLYPAEKLGLDGDVDQMAKNWVNVDSCITYILGKEWEWEHFRMKFTYFAGRYVAAEYTPAETRQTSCIEMRGLKAHAVTSAYETDGSFTCDDERYNQIYDMIEKTVEANMTSGVHTDCPTIERFAWQEPNHLMAPSIMYMKNGRHLWEKFLLDLRMCQHTAEDWFYDMDGGRFYPGDGLVPSQCPCYIPNVLPTPGMGSFYDIIPWGSTCILGTYWHYQFYGDTKIIEDNYDTGMRYLAHLKTKVNKDGFLNHGLGDWGNPRNELIKENIETAVLYADVITLAGFAGILGKSKDQMSLLAYGEEIRKKYNEKLLVWHPQEEFWCYRVWDHKDELFLTQAAEALPLYWGLVPEDKEESVVQALRYTLEKENAFVSGEIGLPYVIQSARKYGMNDLICQYILREEHPSYYAFIRDGETTLGEYWETNPRSHCHDMMGHIIEWYYNGIAGIIGTKPGFRGVMACPYLPDTMKEFTCEYHSASGLIHIHVQETDERILLELACDEMIECEIDTKNLLLHGKPVQVEKKKVAKYK